MEGIKDDLQQIQPKDLGDTPRLAELGEEEGKDELEQIGPVEEEEAGQIQEEEVPELPLMLPLCLGVGTRVLQLLSNGPHSEISKDRADKAAKEEGEEVHEVHPRGLCAVNVDLIRAVFHPALSHGLVNMHIGEIPHDLEPHREAHHGD